MKLKIIAAVLAATLLLSQTAQAAEFTPAPNSRFVVDLDTEAGNLSRWEIDDLAGLSALRMTATVARLGQDARWRPAFAVSVGEAGNEAVFQVVSLYDGQPLKVVVFHRDGKAKPVELRLPTVAVGQAFELQVEWTPAGLVTFSFIPNTVTGTAEQRSIRLDAAPRQVVVSASTGELLLDPVELGR